MSKLYMILYVGMKVGGFAGPVPYGLAECEARVAADNAELAAAIARGKDIFGNPITDRQRSMRFVCEVRDTEPVINY